MPGRVEYINPEGLNVNPAFTQMVTVTGPVKTVYIGAQNSVDGDRNIVGKGDIGAQTEQILKNIDICLKSAGARKEHLISWNIHVAEGQDMRPAFEAGMRWWGNAAQQRDVRVRVLACGLPHLDRRNRSGAIGVRTYPNINAATAPPRSGPIQ